MSDNVTDYDWTLTEERKAQLDLDHKRLAIEHRVSMHRDSQSIRDLRQMLDLLVKAGAPEDSTIHVQKTHDAFVAKGHLRVLAEWSEEQA